MHLYRIDAHERFALTDTGSRARYQFLGTSRFACLAKSLAHRKLRQHCKSVGRTPSFLVITKERYVD